jgi:PAS domain S-box-containing protein
MESKLKLEPDFCVMMDAANDAFAIVEADTGCYAAINNSHIRLFGYSLEELNIIGLGNFYNISNTERTLKKLQQAASYEIFICNVTDKSGNTVSVDLTGSPLDIKGKQYFLLVNTSSSEKINPLISSGIISIEQAFKDSEAKWQSITENSPDHIMLIDISGKVLFINHTVADLSVEQVIGQSCYDFVKPDQVPLLKENYLKVVETGEPIQFEIDYRMEDGVIYFENRVGPVFRNGKVAALMIASRDVTERVKAIKQLEKSQRHLRHALHAGRTGTWEWDIQTNEVTWSDGVEAMFGMKDGSFQGSYDAYKNLIHPDDLEKLELAIENTLTKNTPYYVEHRCIFPDESVHWLCGQGEAYRDDSGNPLRMVGTIQDITERKLSEAALLESQQKLALHFQQTPLGVIDWNKQIEVTEWNPAAEAIFGYSREEALGKSAFDLIIPDPIKPNIDKIWQSLITKTGGKKNTNENITKDGRAILCEWYNTPLVNDSGEVIGVSCLVQDVTERLMAQRELEKHRQRLEELVAERTEEIQEQARIIDQIHDALVAINHNGDVTSWNQGAERILGYSAQEVIGKHISFVYPKDQYDLLLEKTITPLKETGIYETEVILQRKSGKNFYAFLSLTVTQDSQGETTGLVGYAVDISDRKNSEKKIQNQQIALEAANKELEAFSYSVSHDLRSPLRAIDGFSAALFDDYYEILNQDGKDNLKRIRKNAQRMATLIDDLLELSRVTRHEFRKEPISLSLLAQDVIQKYKYLNPDRKIDINIEDNLVAEGDAGLLRIALDNLISNAWKYTEKKESAKIELIRVNDSENLAYCIKDNGVGFDMRYVDKLFGAFQRLHSAEEFSGNGIGLATVYRIINRHGGKIWAEGSVNNGAAFFFTLSNN